MLLTTKNCLPRACASSMPSFKRGDGAEGVVAHPQAVTRLAGVDRIGAKIEGGAHHLE
jgi:hypothetical protein